MSLKVIFQDAFLVPKSTQREKQNDLVGGQITHDAKHFVEK